MYIVVAAMLLPFSRGIARLFVSDSTVLPLVTVFVAVACASVEFRGVDGGSVGPLVPAATRAGRHRTAGRDVPVCPRTGVSRLRHAARQLALDASLVVETAVLRGGDRQAIQVEDVAGREPVVRPDAALDD